MLQNHSPTPFVRSTFTPGHYDWPPITQAGIQTHEDFVMNAYLWLLSGILFRLPMLAASAQFAVVQPGPPVEHFLKRFVQKPIHQPWMR